MRFLRSHLAAAAALMGLVACAGDPATRATAGLSVACDGLATAIDNATPLRAAGKLSPTQVATVDRVIATAWPACSAKGAVMDPATAVALVQSGTSQIVAVVSLFR